MSDSSIVSSLADSASEIRLPRLFEGGNSGTGSFVGARSRRISRNVTLRDRMVTLPYMSSRTPYITEFIDERAVRKFNVRIDFNVCSGTLPHNDRINAKCGNGYSLIIALLKI